MTNGTSGPDTMIGTSDADILDGLGGDDRIDAGTIATETTPGTYDFVYGGAGTDTFVVNAAADTQGLTLQVAGPLRWTLTSVSGDYRVDAFDVERIDFTGGSGADYINTGTRAGAINGGGGNDHWQADLSALSANITFTTGLTGSIAAAGFTSISNIEKTWLTTGSGHDTLTGGDFADSLVAGMGDDMLDGRSRGSEPGSDYDFIDGQDGIDTFVVDASAETQTVSLNVSGTPDWYVTSTSNNIRVDAYSVEKVRFTGGSGNDFIDTGSGGVIVNGAGGPTHSTTRTGTTACSVGWART